MDHRSERFRKLFYDHIAGKRRIKGSQDAKLFLEAADIICKQKSPSTCIENIVCSPKGVEAVGIAVRSGLSTDSVKAALGLFIKHLLSQRVRAIGDGQFLRQLLIAILSPPTFWTALLDAHRSDAIQDQDLETFAQLCLEIVTTQHSALEMPGGDVQQLMKGKTLTEASSYEVRVLAYRIQRVLQLSSAAGPVGLGDSPGGRHDNGFADFRQIEIYPTTDEIRSAEEPFLQRLDDVFSGPKESRVRNHRDWLYRLLREDMLAELREDLLAALGQKKTSRAVKTFKDLSLAEASPTGFLSTVPMTLTISCGDGVTFPRQASTGEDKKKFLYDNRAFMQHRSDVDLLCKSPPVLVVQFTDAAGLRNTLEALLGAKRQELNFVVVNTPTFAYEPILQRLKGVVDVPIVDSLLDLADAALAKYQPPTRLETVLTSLEAALLKGTEVDLSSLMAMTKPVRVRGAQLESLINGLRSSIGQIQGPPGTGKSFIGALIVLLILKLTDHRVLVLSYTNHALDQFLADLMDIGIEEGDMVRLGSKSSTQTQSLALADCTRQQAFRLAHAVWTALTKLRQEASELKEQLATMKNKLKNPITNREILTMLEFSEKESSFQMAFKVPEADNGFHIDRKLDSPSGLKNCIAPEACFAWDIPHEARRQLHDKWSNQVRQDLIGDYMELAETNNQLQRQIDNLFDESKRNVLRSKRVIGCTTTGAAMNQSIISAAEPDVVLVEEAGEILEAHVIVALSPSVKQLCLIGDHKQLRPKVNNFKLTVEKGDGYDLNVSLFERLIRQGHSYSALRQQHRSHPDISHFTRLLAYENLEDSSRTLNRPKVRGLQKRVIFVHHENSEDQLPNVQDQREPALKTSKSNLFEADMVLKMVKYLGQQGYGPQQLVVLVPYLGQLSLLKRKLSESHDPYLNDLDCAELVRAGLMAPAAAGVSKTPLRLSTIDADNYQGEESDIVIVSLTRSNPGGDIGFMCSRERLVVLMSRARDGIVLFGNMHTLMKSKRGGELWREYFEALKDKECLFDGVPVHCERHPQRSLLLKTPKDFDQHCPEGDCAAPCGAMLPCGKHACARRCHRIQDHSKIACPNLVEGTCDRGHKTSVPCGKSSEGCEICADEDEDVRRRAKRDLDLERKRQTSQDEYRRKRKRIEDEIDLHQRTIKYEAEKEEQGKTLSQKQAVLQRLKATRERISAAKEKCCSSREASAIKNAAVDKNEDDELASSANQEWGSMKSHEGALNPALDDLMGLIGLDAVKDEFLSVKSRIDTKIRQGVSLTEERFSCALLGNPGTGKTTVARLWGKFLTSVGAIPGEVFKETTGAKLANDGVSATEAMLEEIKDGGGGVLFIDEAYQLSSGNSPGGRAIMDYLLAEVENLRGKVVFVLAGYRKQMESFFAHNPGLPGRFPVEMAFEDYDDAQLLKILQRKINRIWSGKMAAEGGVDGLFPRIAARRVGRGRGTEGFGNARAIEGALAKI
ncbi:AAA domain-containing protein [Hirsutella rhossiliensis]|uniref:AAA domain-containing protein n=1 Tax=Hirsutella rhossiliensis TaxID=111463 RepID=A0A9P8MYJ7_9HYPO|nr:AAA domain-containing protein [Hirsutella rhossiliensis]KAH0963677.1 AAA domain-containing protein [Hirsutella rhossiliensis]